jgi:hypothetical protein
MKPVPQQGHVLHRNRFIQPGQDLRYFSRRTVGTFRQLSS